MGWSVGFDSNWGRDVGYGVPATCDYPGCKESIDRGLSYVCGGEPFGGEHGCGLYFCLRHLTYAPIHPEDWTVSSWEYLESQYGGDVLDNMAVDQVSVCERCERNEPPFDPSPDVQEWVHHKLTDPSWKPWRDEKGISS